MKKAELALTFADVSLVPIRSRVRSRSDVDTTSRFSRNISLFLPIVSANMDTVTMSAMAIAMAKLGGIGVIHRFLSIEAEAREVEKVKRASNYRITGPYVIDPEDTVGQARTIVADKSVSGLLVIKQGTSGVFNPTGELLGILTHRDMRACPAETKVKEAMTPKARLIVGPIDISLDEAREIMLTNRIEKLPLADTTGRACGLITLRDITQREEFPFATRDVQGRLSVAAAIGIRGDYLERAAALVEAGVDALVLDIAHGHAERALQVIEEVKSRYPKIDLVAGNVARVEAVEDLASAGADGIKAGVGPGAVCSTRIVAGVGVPQWTVIASCSQQAQELDLPLISDGGIREPGDVAKAIGAGASAVMIGSLIAGCDESPGAVVRKNGKKYKVYRGMASREAAATRFSLEGREADELNQYVAEGVEVEFTLKGPVSEVIQELAGGLRSGMSYSDALSILEFWQKAEFVSQTYSGRSESKPHALTGEN